MFKYYLDGKLVRTSKTHDNYAFALVVELPTGKKIVKACSSTINGASRDYSYYRNRFVESVKVYVAPLEKKI